MVIDDRKEWTSVILRNITPQGNIYCNFMILSRDMDWLMDHKNASNGTCEMPLQWTCIDTEVLVQYM